MIENCGGCNGSGKRQGIYSDIECPDCDGEGSWESEGTPVEQFNAAVDREIARQGLTTCEGDPLLKRRRAA